MVRNLGNVTLGEEKTLRATESTEGSVRDGVCLTDLSADKDIRNLVHAVTVGQASLQNGARQVLSMASVGEDIGIKGQKFAFFGDSDLPLAHEWVTLTRGQNILIAVQHAPDRSSGLVCGNGTNSSQLDRA